MNKKNLIVIGISLIAVVLISCHGPEPVIPNEQNPVSFYRLRFELSTTSKTTRVTAQNTQFFLTAHLMGVKGVLTKQGVNMHSLAVRQETGGNSIGITAD